ncbi:type II toxin-antitoxin system Phd/YefM family antitoxin [Sandaracinobacteroides saxicola]|uniref:Antitoxin n=1 Tax=Sandaracinobacteroides saxicola TaxID=2759707 RepID=A0A7G5IIW7_9SPHN|nr:type II toxin-antitoxin system prevent-host-death family antitoxin [Sandaracinobacteroides saxicola]QMW23309.1 type II toxin-antitoxin system Phd/YefM family antitoxin [Sandaracinobacteroides saxicola]
MPAVNVLEAKTHFSRLLAQVESGQATEIIIARNGKPVARLVPIAAEPAPKPQRAFGMGRHLVPENFDWDAWAKADKEMDAEIERMFYGE